MAKRSLVKRPSVAVQTRTVVAMLDKITADGLADVAGLFAKPGDEGYNPDAEIPWQEARTKTRVAVEVYKQAMANSRETTKAAVALGVVALQGRMKAAEWEKKAKEVDDEARQDAIDVASKPVP